MFIKRILVVEDDIHLSNAVYRALRRSYGGVNLTWVSTAESAVEELAKARFDLIVSDYNLAGLKDGVDLWRHCRVVYPAMPFTLISGMPMDSIMRRFQQGEVAPPMLLKPFQMHELVSLFRGSYEDVA